MKDGPTKKETLLCDWMCQEKLFHPPRKKKEISASEISVDFFFLNKNLAHSASSMLLVHSGEVTGGVSNLATIARWIKTRDSANKGLLAAADRFGWSWSCRHTGSLILKKKDTC